MTANLGGWIHSFAVTDTQTHKEGYTIYKITSIVFPRSVPQALTCLTIWKRFHDVKRLHRELNRRHKSLKLPGKLPEPTDCSFFKRFNADVILRRREYILQLLDFAAQHSALYKCHAFAQFFSEPQPQTGLTSINTPKSLPHLQACDTLKGKGSIAEICDKLNLLRDPHDCSGVRTLLDPARDKCQKAVREEPSGVNNTEEGGAFDNAVDDQRLEKTAEMALEQQKPCKDYARFLTPMASIESDDSDYIYEAALEFSRAVQAEANLEYKDAHVRYKRGVEVLLDGAKDDSNDERKFIAKAKISKYLARADDIYDKFLRDGAADGNAVSKTNFQLSIDVSDCNGGHAPTAIYLERPWNNLAKYKVLRVLGERVMQVHCIIEPEPRCTYVMKGLEKPSSNTPTQMVFLPQHVPYMVDLLAFFQSEQKIFLLLKQAEGGRLYDYIQTYTPMAQKTQNLAALFPELSDTGNACNASVSKTMHKNNESAALLALPTEATEFSELVRSSQQLLQSVSNTLKEVKTLNEVSSVKKCPKLPAVEAASPRRSVKGTHLPEASLKQWARELVVAIESLHGKGVILSDLHMENLLLGAKGQLLLTYFYQNEGLDCDNYVHKAYSPLAIAGHFVAPERPLTFKSDWWSYGVILYQLLLGLPFKAAHPGHLDLYGCVQYPENAEISESARDLLDNLLQQMAEERFDYEQIRAHNFFEGTNWDEVHRNGMNTNATITNTGN